MLKLCKVSQYYYARARPQHTDSPDIMLLQESMSADPLKVLEAGRAFNDISMFAKYLAEQPCVYGVYDQDAKRADLEM